MDHVPDTRKGWLITCSALGAIVALAVTLGAVLGWGELPFSKGTYYLLLAIAVWYPLAKLIGWQLWQHDGEMYMATIPAPLVEQRLARTKRTINLYPPSKERSEAYHHGR